MKLGFFSAEPSLARKLARHAIYSIHRFPDGAVGRIVGEAGHVDDGALVAPISGRKCTAWFARVSAGNTPLSDESPVIEGSSAIPFTVDDGTGLALVFPAQASLLLAFDVSETLGLSQELPASVRRFLRDHRKPGQRARIDWRLSWQEGIVCQGHPVAVVGRGHRETDPEPAAASYRAAATRLVMTRAAPADELVVSTFEGSRVGPRAPL